MTELKTLKDLEFEVYGSKDKKVMSKDLRQEAIKWIKELEKEPVDIKEEIMWTAETIITDKNQRKRLIVWIKHFFNITDWDLMNEEEKKKYASEHSHEIPFQEKIKCVS